MPSKAVLDAIQNIRTAIDGAPRNNYTVELHIQMMKYSDILENITGKEFCELLKLNPPWGVEFNKMRKIAARLRNAGLELEVL
jgi:hypothetical protein